MVEILKNNNINSLWHFTDISNLKLINRCGGLLSKTELKKRGLFEQVKSGGDQLSQDLDRRHNNWDKISLSFTPKTPMAFYKKKELHPIYIEIDPAVIAVNNAVFTDTNATSNEHLKRTGLYGLDLVRFDMINKKPDPGNEDWKKYVQAEALIPKQIEIKYFKRIHFPSFESRKLGEQYWGEKSDLFCVNRDIFMDLKGEGEAIDFPLIELVKITPNKLKADQIKEARSTINFKKGQKFYIYIFIKANGIKADSNYIIRTDIKTTNGSLIKQDKKILLKNKNIVRIVPSPDNLSMIADKLIIEIYINNNLWARKQISRV
jgi:hypothetical protein